MDGLLGTITDLRAHGVTENGLSQWEVCCTPCCVLPSRAPVPDWLRGQALQVMREARDVREVGRPGDSLLLTAEESARYLRPLQVEPAQARRQAPETLRVTLRWWAEAAPPPVTVSARGRQVSGRLQAREDGFVAEIATADLFDAPPPLPVVLEVRCGPLRAVCPVLPDSIPTALSLPTEIGEVYRLDNAWYTLEITTAQAGGGLATLREQGRGVEHFRRPDHLIQRPFDYAGHLDRFTTGRKAAEHFAATAMTVAGVRQDSAGTRLYLDGDVAETPEIRTDLNCLLYDHLPLIGWQRGFRLAARPERVEQAVRVPIDAVHPFGCGFRAAWPAEEGRRLLCADGERLVTFAPAQPGDRLEAIGWWMSAGWTLVAHPARRQCLLYLFDPVTPPVLRAERDAYALVLKPWWPLAPARPGDAFTHALALSAGELCGAHDKGGVWLACRTTGRALGVHCAVVARLRALTPAHVARFTLGGEVREQPLQEVLLPGVGPVHYAGADFPDGQMDAPFHVEVAGIPALGEEPG